MARRRSTLAGRDLPWGMGSVQPRGGKWIARWKDIDGVRRGKTFEERDDAEDFLRALYRKYSPRWKGVPPPAHHASIVYFIQVVGNGPIKIGHAHDPLRRLKALQTSCPYELRIIATTPGGVEREVELHAMFSHLRTRLEWFNPEPELLEWIRENAVHTDMEAEWTDERSLKG
jgi:hypothetical protein